MDNNGSRFCVEVVKQSSRLSASRADLGDLILNYATPLKSDPFGVGVLKAYSYKSF
jgi:hypothetical protein